jgi:hypothetical protein
MSLNQRATAEFSTCTPSAPPTADLSIQTDRPSALRSMLDERIGDLASFQKCARSLWRLPAEILKSCLAGTEGLVPFTP